MNKQKNIYWGDIHNHNEIGYGKGALERSFDIAGNALDFYAFTPHTWWPDLPDNDEAVKQHHLRGFEKVRNNWEKIKQTVRQHYRKGGFVTLLAWEWHSLAWGDYCMYFPDDESDFYYASSLDELKEYARKTQAFIVPHHIAYNKGWRGIDWDEFDEEASPVVEVFSEHGNSLEASTHRGMYSHSMGGVETSQTALSNLKNGKRFGFIACTDDHYGYPAGYGHGITAVVADKLDRESIFNAIKNRHTYAATGDRIKIDFSINEGIMGDFIEVANSADVRFQVEARDSLQSVEVFKNGDLFKSYSAIDFRKQSIDTDRHLIKIEWGWDMIASKEITQWYIKLKSLNGKIEDISPNFCGGSASVTDMNLLTWIDESTWQISSFTSRKNACPVNSISFFLTGNEHAMIILEAEGDHDGTTFQKRMSLSKLDLADKDIYESAFDRFSSPKIKVHKLVQADAYSFMTEFNDESARPGDFYFLKVTQANGQMAWTSPIWITNRNS